MPVSTEEKKRFVRDLYEKAFNARDLDYLDQVCGDRFTDYSSGAPGPMDREGLKRFIGIYLQAFPDLRLEIVGDIIAEGDFVAWHDLATGTHLNDFMGIPPTGKQIRIAGIHMVQVDEHGMAKAHWAGIDNLGMMQQLGVIPEPGQSGEPEPT